MARTEHRLVQSHHARQELHPHAFNRWLAVKITAGIGTMWCAYVFMALALISFPAAMQAFLAGDVLTGITWLSQAFLQLVLLPVILVGQRVQEVAGDMRDEAMAESLNQILNSLQSDSQRQP